MIDPTLRRPLAITIGILLLALIPLPGHRAKSAMRSLRSPEPNRADRETHAAGYYVGLIDGGANSSRDELTLRLLGKASEWQSFHDIGATDYYKEQDEFLQFGLKPNLRTYAFGRPFTTNANGQRDREYAVKKPEGTFRIAVLGSSMDMGWGVSLEETYENRLEDWLNAHALRRGLDRRFEVINFAMAAYSPLHRLDSYVSKVRAYDPDLVLYAVTMLDPRLLDIHLRSLVQDGVDLKYDFLRERMASVSASPDEPTPDGGEPRDIYARFKARLKPHLPGIGDASAEELAARCRADGTGMAMVVIPRVGKADSPEERGPAIARFTANAARLKLPVFNLSPAFDDHDPASIEIAPWDDHPNAVGHRLLFESLAQQMVENRDLYRTLFGVDPPEGSTMVPVPEERPATRP